MWEWLGENQKFVTDLTKLVRGEFPGTKNEQIIKRKIVECLLITDVHNRDIVGNMYNHNIQSMGDFLWMQQLRYYLDEKEKICYI